MIQVNELTKKFGSKHVLNSISFQVKDGEILGFLGPNGAGKTTTMRILTGFLSPTAGTITINNKDILEDALHVRKNIGYLPENNPLYQDFRVYELLGFVARARLVSNLGEEMRRVSRICNIHDVINKPIGELSKGYKQRVGLAQALLGDPKILILDEPTSALDPNQASEVRKLISEIGKKKTIIFSTHILQEVTAVCDRALIIHKGAIVADGTPEELARRGSGKEEVIAVIEGPQADVKKALEILPSVTAVEVKHIPNSSEIAYTLAANEGADLRKNIFQLVKQQGWTLLEMQRSKANLETVFQQLTQ